VLLERPEGFTTGGSCLRGHAFWKSFPPNGLRRLRRFTIKNVLVVKRSGRSVAFSRVLRDLFQVASPIRLVLGGGGEAPVMTGSSAPAG